MKRMKKLIPMLLLMMLLMFGSSMTALAAEDNEPAITTEAQAAAQTTSSKAMASALVVAAVGFAGAIAMGMTASKSVEGIARQPEADGKIRTTFMLGLVFIETAIIYALVVAILIIFVM